MVDKWRVCARACSMVNAGVHIPCRGPMADGATKMNSAHPPGCFRRGVAYALHTGTEADGDEEDEEQTVWQGRREGLNEAWSWKARKAGRWVLVKPKGEGLTAPRFLFGLVL